MIDATTFLTIILSILGSILLVGLIILGIKLINTLDKIENTVDNINNKINSLNGLFSIIDFTTNKLANISDVVVENITSLIRKVFYRNKEEEDIKDE